MRWKKKVINIFYLSYYKSNKIVDNSIDECM